MGGVIPLKKILLLTTLPKADEKIVSEYIFKILVKFLNKTL